MAYPSPTPRLAVLCTGLLLAAAVQADTRNVPVAVSVQPDTPGCIVLRYELAGYTDEPVTIGGEQHSHLGLAGEPSIQVAGAPDLPRIARSVIIPDDAEMAVRIVAQRYYEVEDVSVAPSKGVLLRTVDPESVPYIFGDVYQQDAFYPGELVRLRQPYIMRDYRGVVVELNPLRYNPVTRTLRVYTDVTLEVISVGTSDVNVLTRRPAEISRAFHQIYSRHFLNYDSGLRYDPLDETGDLLIICHDAWLANVQPLVDHKNAIGINTTAIGVSTIGNNSNSIKSHIQDVYDNSDLAFVLLVGDGSEVDTPYAAGGSSDPSYALLAGGDNYPDILVGRFSAQSAGQVDTQVLRTIEYEELPATEETWFKQGTGIASNQGPGHNGEYDDEHIDLIRDDLLAYGYTVVDQIYDPYGTASQVSNALNAGRGIVNYCGHGSRTSWVSTGFSNSHVDSLVNDNMLPFIVSVACVNGQFDGYTCFAEAWLRATHGSEPTGAIAVYMSSVNQSWDPPMTAQDESVDLLVGEAYFSFGALCFAGSCRMMDYHGSAGVEMFLTWHVFGDPSVRVYGTAEPPMLTITLPDGAPEYLAPGEPTAITVQIVDGVESYAPGTGTIHHRFDGGAYQADPVTPLGGDLYEAVLPAAACDATPEFYFSATGDGGTTVYLPADAPGSCYAAVVGVPAVVVDDDIEDDLGWTVGAPDDDAATGIWNRMDPEGTEAQPEDDHTSDGTICWVTDGYAGDGLGANDVDDGKTTLFTPTFDLSDVSDPTVNYWRWYSNDTGAAPNADVFEVDISNDGGTSWVNVETVGPSGPGTSGGWFYYEFRLADVITPTTEVKLRFVASDEGSGSLVEAAVDDFRIDDFACEDPNPCFGDLDGDNDIDLADLSALLANYGTSGAGYEDGDLDGDGDVDLADLSALLAVYGTSCE